MAVGIHIARVNFVPVNSLGVHIDKNGETDNPATIGEMTDFTNEHRIIPDPALPNTANYPTVTAYLEAEADGNFVLHYMDQNRIVTYEHDAGTLS